MKKSSPLMTSLGWSPLQTRESATIGCLVPRLSGNEKVELHIELQKAIRLY